MIKVYYNNETIKVDGHANFADYGRDIVCASVSSIIYTTINGILNINNKSIQVIDDKSLIINIISNDDVTMKLIDNMITLLKELEKQYPKNIKISKGE
jgi:uncharacterized protein YsxB (DUF464 family)